MGVWITMVKCIGNYVLQAVHCSPWYMWHIHLQSQSDCRWSEMKVEHVRFAGLWIGSVGLHISYFPSLPKIPRRFVPTTAHNFTSDIQNLKKLFSITHSPPQLLIQHLLITYPGPLLPLTRQVFRYVTNWQISKDLGSTMTTTPGNYMNDMSRTSHICQTSLPHWVSRRDTTWIFHETVKVIQHLYSGLGQIWITTFSEPAQHSHCWSSECKQNLEDLCAWLSARWDLSKSHFLLRTYGKFRPNESYLCKASLPPCSSMRNVYGFSSSSAFTISPDARIVLRPLMP